MKKHLFLIPLLFAVASYSSAASYKITIPESVVVDGKELKPCDYRVEVNDQTAVIRSGKSSTEVKVRIEDNDRKYDSTTVRCSRESGKYNLQEIHVGGTKTKMIFDSLKSANGGI